MQLILVGISRDNLHKYGKDVTKSFLGLVLTIVFGASILYYICQPSHTVSYFYTK